MVVEFGIRKAWAPEYENSEKVIAKLKSKITDIVSLYAFSLQMKYIYSLFGVRFDFNHKKKWIKKSIYIDVFFLTAAFYNYILFTMLFTACFCS